MRFYVSIPYKRVTNAAFTVAYVDIDFVSIPYKRVTNVVPFFVIDHPISSFNPL